MLRTVSFRVSHEELAKALDGLIASGIDPNNLMTISNIVRNTFYYGIISFCKYSENNNPDNDNNNPDNDNSNDANETNDDNKSYDLPSQESLQKINQLLNQNKRTKIIGLKELLKKQ